MDCWCFFFCSRKVSINSSVEYAFFKLGQFFVAQEAYWSVYQGFSCIWHLTQNNILQSNNDWYQRWLIKHLFLPNRIFFKVTVSTHQFSTYLFSTQLCLQNSSRFVKTVWRQVFSRHLLSRHLFQLNCFQDICVCQTAAEDLSRFGKVLLHSGQRQRQECLLLTNFWWWLHFMLIIIIVLETHYDNENDDHQGIVFSWWGGWGW